VDRLLGESWAFGAEYEGVFGVWGLILGEGVDVDGVALGGEGEGLEAGGFDGCEGWEPVGLVLDLEEGDGEGVSHGDAEGFSVEGVAAFWAEDDGDGLGTGCATECGGGAEDGAEVVVIGEVFEDDEGSCGLKEGVDVRFFTLGGSMACGEEASVDGVAGDLVEDWSWSGVDGDLIGDLVEEGGVGFCFGLVDEDGVEFVGGVEVVLEDEGAFGDEEGVFFGLAD